MVIAKNHVVYQYLKILAHLWMKSSIFSSNVLQRSQLTSLFFFATIKNHHWRKRINILSLTIENPHKNIKTTLPEISTDISFYYLSCAYLNKTKLWWKHPQVAERCTINFPFTQIFSILDAFVALQENVKFQSNNHIPIVIVLNSPKIPFLTYSHDT